MRYFILGIILQALFLTNGVWASFDMTPITRSVTPAGNGATANFVAKNLGDEKVPVQITIVPREPDMKGDEHLKDGADSDDQFTIYPSQFILKPREAQTIRVTWVGNPKVTSELAFRMISEELPVIIEEPGKTYKKPVGRIVVTARYIGSLYVTPPGAQYNLVIKASPSDKKGHLILDIENKGTEHRVLKEAKIKFVAVAAGGAVAGKEVELPIDGNSPLYNQNILAGKMRRIEIPWPSGLPAGQVRATFIPNKE